MEIVDKIQFYIPSLLDFLDANTKIELDQAKIVGVKTSNVKYFIEYPKKIDPSMNQIVAEDFTLYDLQLDFQAKKLSFYIQSDRESSRHEILQQVFQSFVVKYSSKKMGFFLYVNGRNRPNFVRVK